MSIAENLQKIHQRIENACLKSGRNPKDVKLLMATKTVSAENIKIALACDENLIGENKVQELKEKYDALKSIPHRTHFIGHLQSNKIKEVIKYADCIQSIDRISLVKELHKTLEKQNKTMDILLQVNTSFEQSKFGFPPHEVINFAKEVSNYSTLKIKGLMTIGLFSSEEAKVRRCFKILREIRDEIRDLNINTISMEELSMGMSNDLETAIEEGSTMVRVGTDIFGKRIHPDSYYWDETMKLEPKK